MANKKSLDLSVKRFRTKLDEVKAVLDLNGGGANKRAVHEWAIISCFAAFEGLMMDIFVTALNRNPAHFTAAVSVPFPKHLTLATCRYLIVGDGYFGFRDRDDLKDQCRKFLGAGHPFLDTLKGEEAAVALEVLVTARNYAAHQGDWAKEKLRKTLKKRGFPGAAGLGYAGNYLAAIDNSDKWRKSFDIVNGNSRIKGILKYLSKVGNAVESKVIF
jgi:hypothetical protein